MLPCENWYQSNRGTCHLAAVWIRMLGTPVPPPEAPTRKAEPRIEGAYSPKESKYLKKAYLAQTILLMIPYTEAQSPHYVGTGAFRECYSRIPQQGTPGTHDRQKHLKRKAARQLVRSCYLVFLQYTAIP